MRPDLRLLSGSAAPMSKAGSRDHQQPTGL